MDNKHPEYLRAIEDAARAIEGERLEDPQPGTSDEGYEQALDDALAAIRKLGKG